MSPCRHFLVLLLLVFGCSSAFAQRSPVNLTTSETEALTTIEVKLDLSPTRQQLLSVDFGFGSNEPADFQGFFDSFSMTLQKRDQSATALFFTIDRTGIQLAPNNPGGLTIPPSQLRLSEIPSPASLAEFDYHISYHLTFNIPSQLGAPDTLFFDLFSNQNNVNSAVYFQDLRIWPPPVVVQSASLLNGLFTGEPDAYLDLVAMTADIPKIRPEQFFRARGNVPVKLTLAAVLPQELVLDFEFRPNRLVLLSAPTEAGPFSEVSGTFNPATQIVTTVAIPGPRAFRIESDVPVTIQSTQTSGGVTSIAYRFQAGSMTLLTSQGPGGPYVDSVDAKFDSDARKIHQPRIATYQFFRLSSEAGYRVKSIQDRTDSWLLHIE